ncbi:MAG: MoaD/ThiS family protein [Promethearchaeota archaeon]
MMNEKEDITITVKFFADLKEFGPAKEQIRVPSNSTVEYLSKKYKIPLDRRNVVILINGKPHKTIDTRLKDGDIIAIFPPIGGG